MWRSNDRLVPRWPASEHAQRSRTHRNSRVATVDHKGDAALLETGAKFRTVTVRQHMIKDGTGDAVVLDKDHGMLKRVGRRYLGTRSFKCLGDIQCN